MEFRLLNIEYLTKFIPTSAIYYIVANKKKLFDVILPCKNFSLMYKHAALALFAELRLIYAAIYLKLTLHIIFIKTNSQNSSLFILSTSINKIIFLVSNGNERFRG